MKHVACVFSGFQTHSNRCRYGIETVQVQRAIGLEVCGCGASAG